MAERVMNGRGRAPWRLLGWIAAGALLLSPAVAMRFTDEVNWTGSDFAVMGAMLLVAGLSIELLVRMSGQVAYRLGALVAVGAAFLLVWANLAVGVLGSEDNPANLLFAGVLGVAVAAAALGRFRPAGMARAMAATAGAQLVVGLVGFAAGWASPGSAGVYEVTMGTALFGGLWLLAAGLFAMAARREGPTTRP